jgi:hypothetical protein
MTSNPRQVDDLGVMLSLSVSSRNGLGRRLAKAQMQERCEDVTPGPTVGATRNLRRR